MCSVPTVYFITHPQVVVDPAAPVPQWRLSDVGLRRMTEMLRQPWVPGISRIFASTERKAVEGAAVLAHHLDLSVAEVVELGEIDRSATGYLPHEEHERVTDEFFAEPERSVRGWERAVDAQRRIVAAVGDLRGGTGDVAVVSHGAVGALLLCHLTGSRIARDLDQPAGGGQYFAVQGQEVLHRWRPIDQVIDPSTPA